MWIHSRSLAEHEALVVMPQNWEKGKEVEVESND